MPFTLYLYTDVCHLRRTPHLDQPQQFTKPSAGLHALCFWINSQRIHRASAVV